MKSLLFDTDFLNMKPMLSNALYNRFYFNEHSLRTRLDESMENFFQEFGVHIEPHVLAVKDDSWIPVVMDLVDPVTGKNILKKRYQELWTSRGLQ